MGDRRPTIEFLRHKCKYLGDGVYAHFDGYQIWLYVSNGVEVTDAVALEDPVFNELVKFRKVLQQEGNG